MEKILFVEDNAEYRTLIYDVLLEKGYEVDAFGDVLKAIQFFTLNDYDLVITDLKMENINGVEFLRYIKGENPSMKTMILTANPSSDTELEAIDIYVDKYLSKDTRMDVLLRYIEVLLEEETQWGKKKILNVRSEELVVIPLTFSVTKKGNAITLTRKEFDILVFLLSNRGKAISREKFLEEIWDLRYEDTDSRVIDMHIKSIRRKLNTQSILSIRGYGYKWDS